ncbi:MAG: sulfotransferase [Synergistaceae bacterium]|nr:sulfotransferase [Synergistaceae bacterium]
MGPKFMEATQKFINSLISFEHSTHAWDIDFRNENSVFILFRRVINKICKIFHVNFSVRPTGKLYVTDINDMEFLSSAQKYMDDLFTPLAQENKAKHVVLDQAVSQLNYKREMSFIRDSKLIVVDRDPRDIFADWIKCNSWSFAEKRDVSKYIKLFRSFRRNYRELEDDASVLTMRFEDIIFHYDETLKLIADFVGLDMSEHIHKREFFNPDISIKNVGMWKNILSQSEVDAITSELSDFLYVR